MSLKSRVKKLECSRQTNKEQPWFFGKSPVGLMPPAIIGMMVMSERAGRGEIPFDRELTDELAWLDSAYQGDFKGEYCHGYIEFCDAFMRDFEANY